MQWADSFANGSHMAVSRPQTYVYTVLADRSEEVLAVTYADGFAVLRRNRWMTVVMVLTWCIEVCGACILVSGQVGSIVGVSGGLRGIEGIEDRKDKSNPWCQEGRAV